MQGENINILKNGIRILKPSEFKKLIDAIPKVEHKDKLEALLFTGCRYTELQWLYENPSAFSDGIIRMPSMKTASRHKERYIRLNNNGKRAVQYFLRSNRNLPDHPGWDANLKRWCKYAELDPEGICCKTTRRTWESWLVAQYKNNLPLIFLSQGHTDRISMEFYLMLPFAQDDKEMEEMRLYTDGWV